MTRPGFNARFLMAAALGLALLGGCKKPAPPKAVTAAATPTPSPDKDAIAYIRSGQIWLMKWDGSGAGALLASRNASFWFPSASPKGDDLLAWVSRSDGSEDVVRVRLDGKYELLTSMGERALPAMKNLRLGNSPAYDSKAERIAYSYNGRIWIMNRDGYDAQTLVSDGLSYSPVWSPDDKKIAYVNGKNGHYDLWVTDVDSHDTWQVTDFQDFTVGQPRWVSEGKRLMVTRSQKDESDIVQVLADTDVPLVDADVLTKDHASASADMNKDGKYLAYSAAAPASPTAGAEAEIPVWEIWVSDAAAKESKRLSHGGGSSPCWIRPSVPSSVAAAVPAAPVAPAMAALPPKPTQVPALPKPAAPAAPAAAPTAVPTAPAKAPVAPAAAPTAAPKAPAPLPTAIPTALAKAPAPAPAAPAPAAAPTPQPKAVQAAGSPPINSKPAPTQPPAKAAPLRVRLRVAFDPDSDQLMLASMTELKKTASRVKQYSGEAIEVYGPLDRSSLRGRYASEEDRSKARAEQVAAALSRESGIPAATIKALAHAPVVIGAQAPNGIEIHVELK